jgi:hypothetical protein
MWSHGHFYWNELMTRNPEQAKSFYGATIGWTFEAMPTPDGTYWVAKLGDEAASTRRRRLVRSLCDPCLMCPASAVSPSCASLAVPGSVG